MSALFRLAGLLVSLVTGVIGLAEVFAEGPAGLAGLAPELAAERRGTAFLFLVVALAGLLAVFCALFLLATGRRRFGEGKLAAILAAQLSLGLFFPDLMFVVAFEAGYLLSQLRSRWMFGQVLFLSFVLVAGHTHGGLSPAPELARTEATLGIALTIAQVLVWQIFAFAAGYHAGCEADARHRLAIANVELQTAQQVLTDSARNQERVNIARDVHDTMGHHLAALSLKLQLAAKGVEGATGKTIEDAHLIARLLLSDLRLAVSTMREPRAVDLAGALRNLEKSIEYPKISLEMAVDLPVRDPATAMALLRCAQEAVTNAVRHARARSIHLRLVSNCTGVELVVADDGQGAAAVREGNGLCGIRERVDAAGGTMRFETAPGQGFRLFIQVPVPPEAA
jgi:signal transduction histidine kinase